MTDRLSFDPQPAPRGILCDFARVNERTFGPGWRGTMAAQMAGRTSADFPYLNAPLTPDEIKSAHTP